MHSSEAAEQIEKALLERSGIRYSVTAGRGTFQSWVVVDIAVERRALATAPVEREALAKLLGFDHWEGTILVPGTVAARREYLSRALGVDGQDDDTTTILF
jgi:hypothetical protein